jgi:hypothetical protein
MRTGFGAAEHKLLIVRCRAHVAEERHGDGLASINKSSFFYHSMQPPFFALNKDCDRVNGT